MPDDGGGSVLVVWILVLVVRLVFLSVLVLGHLLPDQRRLIDLFLNVKKML
jgi:hypothetical protein